MQRSRKTDFQKLKIILVGSTYPGQRPQCPSLSNMFSCVCMFVTHSFSTRATGTTTNNNLTLASNWLYPLVTASVHDIGPSRPISLKKCNKQSININDRRKRYFVSQQGLVLLYYSLIYSFLTYSLIYLLGDVLTILLFNHSLFYRKR